MSIIDMIIWLDKEVTMVYMWFENIMSMFIANNRKPNIIHNRRDRSAYIAVEEEAFTSQAMSSKMSSAWRKLSSLRKSRVQPRWRRIKQLRESAPHPKPDSSSLIKDHKRGGVSKACSSTSRCMPWRGVGKNRWRKKLSNGAADAWVWCRMADPLWRGVHLPLVKKVSTSFSRDKIRWRVHVT